MLLLEAKKAAGEWRTGSLMPNPQFLMACAQCPASWLMATWMIAPRGRSASVEEHKGGGYLGASCGHGS